MKGDDTLSENTTKPLIVIDDYTTPVIVKGLPDQTVQGRNR